MMGLWLLLGATASAEEVLKVGIKPSEPWVMYDAQKPEGERQPVGFSVDLWNEIAKKLAIKTEWVYYDSTNDLIKGTSERDVNVGIAAITVTADRERQVDFSNSMYELGLQIMVSPEFQQSNPFAVMVNSLVKLFNWKTLLLLAIMLFLTANLRLWLDRNDKHNAFMPAGYVNGLRESLWWGMTMLLTWETPRSRGFARVVDLSWHLIGLIILSILTAVVTSALTAQAVSGTIRSEQDLPGKAVAAVASDAPRKWLEQNGIDVTPVNSVSEGIEQVRKGEVDALVHDGPRLVYLARKINQQEGKKALAVVPASFNPQSYGIAFPEGSELRESVNQALLDLRESKDGNKSVYDLLREKWIKK
ncbi:MAG: transporter substrate-binding domain-containing protein [bacterium]